MELNVDDGGWIAGNPDPVPDPPAEPPPEPEPPAPPPPPPPAPPAPAPPGYGDLPDPASYTGSYVNAQQVQDLIEQGEPAALVLAWQRAVNEALAARGVPPPAAPPPAPAPAPTAPPPSAAPAPPAAGDVDGDRSASLPPEDGPELAGGERGLQSVTGQILRHGAFVDAVYRAADFYNLDPLAVFANALAEGKDGTVGDGGIAYGPWQMHATDGRLRSFTGLPPNSTAVQAWTWMADGVDYALRSMVAGGAAGLRGHDAVDTIVYGFEKPAKMHAAAGDREQRYDTLVERGDGVRVWLNGQFPGPAGDAGASGGSTSSASGGGGAVAGSPDPGGDVETAWLDLQRTLALDWQGYAGTIHDARRSLAAAVS